jgi:thiamine biosynthesis lipoprotein
MTSTRATFPAFGGRASVVVSDPVHLSLAEEAVRRTAADFDLACSRFRPDSELCALNAAAGSAVRVGELLLEAVSAALRAAALTEGDVDPTVGGALLALGYDRDFDTMPELIDTGRSSRRVSVRVTEGWRGVQLDARRQTVRVPRGVSLDLGATAKGLAADRAADRASEACGGGVLVSFGGDIALAGEPPAGGWVVRVTDDHRAGLDAPGQSITLSTGGLATSSRTVRRWQTTAGEANHLVVPATGEPVAGPWRTASVSAASCLDANTASTAAMVRGASAPGWLASLGLASRLVDLDGHVRHVAGWPTAGDDLPRASVRSPVPA